MKAIIGIVVLVDCKCGAMNFHRMSEVYRRILV